MTHRLLSIGNGRPQLLVIGYLIQPDLDDAIRAALHGACIIAYSDAAGEPLITTKLRAHDAGWTDGPLVFLGFSKGCLDGIRQRLLDGAAPHAVVAIDGTHADMPPKAWQLDPWKRLATEARAGRTLFVATHTQISYVEREPDPYQSTATTLRQITGWPLAEAGPLPLGVEHSDGALHVHSYQSGPADGAAHAEQARVALPEMLRRYVAPWLGLRPVSEPPATERTPATTVTSSRTSPRMLRRGCFGNDVSALQERLHELGYDPGSADGAFGPVTETAVRALQAAARIRVDAIVGPETRATLAAAKPLPAASPAIRWETNFGAAVLAVARTELAAGVRETIGPNDGARIRDYFAGTGAAPGSNWCAAFVRYCIRAAGAKLGAEPPIAGSVGARATMEQLKRAGRWIGADELRQFPERAMPGMTVVFWRGQPTGWMGHIGIVSDVDGGTFRSIEGNSGEAADRIAENAHSVGDVHLLGAAWLD
jgi:peptidoglycan hydrolase-like protein with peptidoglycan-binding domain